MALFFISYAKKDGIAYARELKQNLEKAGLPSWIDETDIGMGKEWRIVIDNALEASICVIVVVTNEALNSHNVTYEWSTAKALNKEIIPLLFENIDSLTLTHHPLFALQFRDFTNIVNRPWGNLIEDLRHVKTQKAIHPTVVEAERILNTPDPSRWVGAIETLKHFEDPSAIEALARLVSNHSPEVSIRAALALNEKTNYSDPRSIPGMIKYVLKSKEWNHWYIDGYKAPLVLFQRINNPDSIDILINLMNEIQISSNSPDNKKYYIEALAQISHPYTLPHLRRLFDDPSIEVNDRNIIATAIAQFRDPDTFPALTNYLKNKFSQRRWKPLIPILKILYPYIIDDLIEFGFQLYDDKHNIGVFFDILDAINESGNSTNEGILKIVIHEKGIPILVELLDIPKHDRYGKVEIDPYYQWFVLAFAKIDTPSQIALFKAFMQHSEQHIKSVANFLKIVEKNGKLPSDFILELLATEKGLNILTEGSLDILREGSLGWYIGNESKLYQWIEEAVSCIGNNNKSELLETETHLDDSQSLEDWLLSLTFHSEPDISLRILELTSLYHRLQGEKYNKIREIVIRKLCEFNDVRIIDPLLSELNIIAQHKKIRLEKNENDLFFDDLFDSPDHYREMLIKIFEALANIENNGGKASLKTYEEDTYFRDWRDSLRRLRLGEQPNYPSQY
ncbi:MAG: TIR domain-containing protein [Anaerolineae bacterium]|nr:TIR domain-containing protein [Anaerolineae bacterium]